MWRRFLYNLVLAVPFLLGFAGLLVIMLVDPYGVRSTGILAHRLAEHRYPDREWPRLIGVTTRQSNDLVLVGGSTFMRVDPAMLRAAYPLAKAPLNLSYIAPRPSDFGPVIGRILAMPNLKHVIIVLDFSLLDSRGRKSASGEHIDYISTTTLFKAADFSFISAAASMHRLLFGTYDLPSWEDLEQPDFMIGAQPIAKDEKRMRRVYESVATHFQDVFGGTSMKCKDIPFIDEYLVPNMEDAKDRGIVIDLVFPPLPYLLYYDWIDNRPKFDILMRGPIFSQFMTFKKCIVEAVDNMSIENVRVISVDTEDSISGDLSLYMDSAHLLSTSAFENVLALIANRNEELRSDTLAGHEARLRAKTTAAGYEMLGKQF